jgi:hypothetical protein
MVKEINVEELFKKWKPMLEHETVDPIKSNKVKLATAIMLENQFNFMTEGKKIDESSDIEGTLNRSGSYSTNGDFYKVALPMVRRTFPELIAHDIVGVQPMTAPVGLAFAIRFRAGSTGSTYVDGSEVGYNTIETNYSLTTPVSAAEALGSKAGSGVGNDFGIGKGAGTHIKELQMTLEKAQVEAKTRKLRSRWSQEVAQDLKAMHGLNIESEMMDLLSYEITAEIDRELIETIRTAATASATTSAGWDYSTADGRWESEKYRNFYNMIIRKSNEIAITTRRGAGNWVIAHPTCCAMLETLSAFTIWPVKSNIDTAVTGVAKVGTLDNRMVLYRDTFATTEDVVVGFKGKSEYDTGVVYLPYVQLLASKATFEDSFNPTIGLMSRYAIHSHIFGAALYYRYIITKNLTFTE